MVLLCKVAVSSSSSLCWATFSLAPFLRSLLRCTSLTSTVPLCHSVRDIHERPGISCAAMRSHVSSTLLLAASAIAAPTTDWKPSKGHGYGNSSSGESYGEAQYRANAVKEAFEFAWDGYYKYAFPNDELLPVNNSFSNSRYVTSPRLGLQHADIFIGMVGVLALLMPLVRLWSWRSRISLLRSWISTFHLNLTIIMFY